MKYAVQWLLSLIFAIQMYLAMAVMAIVFFPLAIYDRKWAYYIMKFYCTWVRWTASWIIGLKSEIRGTPPTDEALVAAKHQSFFDVLVIFSGLPRGKFIMKKLLKWAPFLGWYAMRINCVPVNRGRKSEAIKEMMESVESGRIEPGQLIIYPQGTRVAPDKKAPYKIGAALLYEQLGQSCVPVATNIGVFWPRRGVYRKRGVAVVEFLPAIPPGKDKKDFMIELETVIEEASDRLAAEAGFEQP